MLVGRFGLCLFGSLVLVLREIRLFVGTPDMIDENVFMRLVFGFVALRGFANLLLAQLGGADSGSVEYRAFFFAFLGQDFGIVLAFVLVIFVFFGPAADLEGLDSSSERLRASASCSAISACRSA